MKRTKANDYHLSSSSDSDSQCESEYERKNQRVINIFSLEKTKRKKSVNKLESIQWRGLNIIHVVYTPLSKYEPQNFKTEVWELNKYLCECWPNLEERNEIIIPVINSAQKLYSEWCFGQDSVLNLAEKKDIPKVDINNVWVKRNSRKTDLEIKILDYDDYELIFKMKKKPTICKKTN